MMNIFILTNSPSNRFALNFNFVWLMSRASAILACDFFILKRKKTPFLYYIVMPADKGQAHRVASP